MFRTLLLTSFVFSSYLHSAEHTTRADWIKHRNEQAKHTKWYHKMDTGPVWAYTFGDYYQGEKRTGALKGLRLELSKNDDIFSLFDTETLRFSTVYHGGLHWGATPWTGAHGKLISMANETGNIFQNASKAGWADKNGSFADDREFPGHGNLAEDHARWNGHYRHGEQMILDYSVLGSRVLEMPTAKVVNGHPAAFRQFDLAPCDHDRILLVASHEGSIIKIDKKGLNAMVLPTTETNSKKKPNKKEKKLTVIMDRTDEDWDKLRMGAPSSKDLIDRKSNKKTFFRVIPEFTQTHAAGGDEEGVAVRLNDGAAARGGKDRQRSFLFANNKKPGRLELNLRTQKSINSIHLYSAHRAAQVLQDVEIYGTTNEHANPTIPAEKITQGGWKKITAYNTRHLQPGGKHGVAIVTKNDKAIGEFHKLLFICKPCRPKDELHTLFSEIDVYGDKAPAIKPVPRQDTQLAVAVRGSGISLKDAGNGSLTLHIPASKRLTQFSIGYITTKPELLGKARLSLQKTTPAPRELASLTKGGPTVYPQTVTVNSELAIGDDTWLVDQIGLPVENPWHSNIRAGGFDLFSDGDSAAISTWNGDVWIVRGLKGDWKQVQWRRFATGLFETLGLKIVDDVIYVHGRDQLTRLHDQNNDGEADWYECFNNDVLITKNFHEFAFSLQTDKEGNFYITKGAPVLGGGRGFDKILPHNGTVMRISKDGKNLEVLATGIRAPGGLGVGPNGEITTGENEGTWQPCCKLNYFTGKNKFLGVEDAAHHLKGQKLHEPLCYFPMRIDNSGGGQVWAPKNSKWGLKSNELVHLSYGKSSLYRVLKEEVGGMMQGGVVRIPVKLKSSAMRARFHQDGSMYVLGYRGWQTNAATPQAFHRIRYNNKPVTIPDQLKATDKGLYIRFEKELDASTVADKYNFKVERWKYMRTKQYGSGEFSIDNPDLKAEKLAHERESKKHRKHDQVEIARSTLLPDKKTVFLHIPSMKPAQQMSIVYKLKFANQSSAEGEIVNTVHKMNPHQDSSLLGQTQNETVTNDQLQPGLVQKISVDGKSDHRVNRLPALQVDANEAASDMLEPGKFTSEWSGVLKIEQRMSPQFALHTRGAATLTINGKEILKVSDEKDAHSKALSDAVQLDPGKHPFSLKYNSSSAAGHVRVLWKTGSAPLHNIPATYFAHKPHHELTQALALRQGRDLLLEQKCTACHSQSNKKNLPDILEKGPDMKGIGSRVSSDWIAQWLAKPHTLNPGTTMPAFVDANTEKGRQDAADMAAYLATITEDTAAQPEPQSDTQTIKLGGGKFHMLGCVACHNLPGTTLKKDNNRTPLHNISSKFTGDSLVKYLSKPDKHYSASKMPDFQLSQPEATQLAAFLMSTSKGKGTPATKLPQGNVARGKQLVVSHNCAACHNDLEPNPNKLADFNTILSTNWQQKGCASEKPSAKSPRFNLTTQQRKLLEQFRAEKGKNAPQALAHTSSHDYTDRQFKSLNCIACHSRDEEPSLLASIHAQSQHLMKGVPVDDRNKVDQSRPQLTYIGEMLHTDYIQRTLDGKVSKRARPWLSMRMPAFQSRAKLMATGLSKQHGMAPSTPKAGDIDPTKTKVGKKLVGSNGGFACNICHADGDTKATAAFEVEGINFDQVAQRLRPGFYHRWMENPQSINPTTKMPRYTQDNKSPLPDYNNDAQKQFDAILEYFRSLEK